MWHRMKMAEKYDMLSGGTCLCTLQVWTIPRGVISWRSGQKLRGAINSIEERSGGGAIKGGDGASDDDDEDVAGDIV